MCVSLGGGGIVKDFGSGSGEEMLRAISGAQGRVTVARSCARGATARTGPEQSSTSLACTDCYAKGSSSSLGLAYWQEVHVHAFEQPHHMLRMRRAKNPGLARNAARQPAQSEPRGLYGTSASAQPGLMERWSA
jgi:hypothetical protein